MGLWSKLKRAVKRAVKAVVNAVQEVVSRIVRLPNIVLTYLGILSIRKVKLRIIIFRKPDGARTAKAEDVLPLVEKARQILRDSARLDLVPTSGEFIWEVDDFAPAAAVQLRGEGFGLLRDQLGEAGEFFDEMIQKYHADATFPYNLITTPVTGFVVERIHDLNGVAMPVIGNWFAIDPDAFAPVTPTTGPVIFGPPTASSIIAHELGHNMGWFTHRDEPENLMFQGDERGYLLTQGQLVVMRSSRCVSLW